MLEIKLSFFRYGRIWGNWTVWVVWVVFLGHRLRMWQLTPRESRGSVGLSAHETEAAYIKILYSGTALAHGNG